MHQRRLYAVAFLAVLLIAAAGAYGAARAVGQVEVAIPRLDFLTSVQEIVGSIDINALIPRRNPSVAAVQPAAEVVVPSPQVVVGQETLPTAPAAPASSITVSVAVEATASGLTPAPIAAATARPTATPAPPTPTPTVAAQPTIDAAFPFLPAGAVRHSSGDCAGPSIRGTVRNASGSSLVGVRLWRYDQWGNEQTVESKSGAADLGQYDFPLGDIANVHYVQVVDAGGSPISAAVEIQHRQGEAPDAACHWLDWVRR